MAVSRKEDMKAALEGRQPSGAVPIWELSFHPWNAFSPRPVILGREFEALTSGEQERALHRNAEIIGAVSSELCFAAITVPGNYWEVGPGVPWYYWLPEEARWRQTEILVKALGNEFLLVGLSGGVLGMPGPSDFVEFSYRLMDTPDAIDGDARRTFESGMENVKRFRDLGVEVLCSPSDIADNRGVFFNPVQMKRYVLPYLRDWAEGVRALGGYSILHTDGDLMPCLEDLADSGMDALQAIDPVAGMDIRKVKAQVGDRLCLCGNVDCGLLLTGTPERVYDATRRLLLDCKLGGGFILGASNAVQEEVPSGNYRAMIEAWKRFGRYDAL